MQIDISQTQARFLLTLVSSVNIKADENFDKMFETNEFKQIYDLRKLLKTVLKAEEKT